MKWLNSRDIQPIAGEAYLLKNITSNYAVVGFWDEEQSMWRLDNTDHFYNKVDYEFCCLQRDVLLAPYRVSVRTLVASNGTTYIVCIDRGDRPLDAKPWDTGRITPYCTPTRKNAEYDAKEWAEFLGVEVTE